MIRLQDLTPAIYYNQSRDFQFIGRLYDIVLNSVKTNATNLYNLPIGQNMDEQLLNLLAMTLGFKTTKHYSSKQLLAICSSLPTILRHKGSIQALVLATNALLTAEGIKQALDYTLVPNQGITLYIAQELSDLTLFTDLLDYLLPAGLSCTIVKESQEVSKIETGIEFSSKVKINNVDSADSHRGADDWIDGILSSKLSVLAELEDRDSTGNIIAAGLNDSKTSFTDLSIGEVGIKPSITSNVTIAIPPLKPKTTTGATPTEGETENDD